MTNTFPRTLADKLAPGNSALIVVDVQNDFCAPDGVFGKAGSDLSMVEPMVANLERLIQRARAAQVPVIFIRSIYDPAYLPPTWHERNARIGFDTPRCVSGTWGADYYRVAPRAGDVVVTKHRFSAFTGTDLDLILRSQGIKTVVMTGIATNICVDSTARAAFMSDYFVVVADDACAAYNRAQHDATLVNIDVAFGVVHKAEDVIENWR